YGLKEKYGQIEVPAYFVTGWYDNSVHENWLNFLGFREKGGSPGAREGTKIIVGPRTHSVTVRGGDVRGQKYDADFGNDTTVDLNKRRLRWYDFWLKGMENGIADDAPIRIFVMGANKWRTENEWPLARTKWTSYYLKSAGKVNSLNGDGELSLSPGPSTTPNRFIYDPENPVPTLGGQICVFPEIQGPRDRRPVESRDNALVFTSSPLEKDTEVTGPVEA